MSAYKPKLGDGVLQEDTPNFQKAAKDFFEPQLEGMGLGERLIASQSLKELEKSLARIDDAIQHPENFGTIKLNFGATGLVYIAKAEGVVEVGILPLLLQRKKQILDRIGDLQKEQKVESLSELVATVSDETLRSKLIEEIEQFERDAVRLKEEVQTVDNAKSEEDMKVKIELARLQAELFERRSKVWQTFIEKESVATIVGSVLLILLALALIVAMFTETEPMDILSNAFLVVLGYFFGQTITRRKENNQA